MNDIKKITKDIVLVIGIILFLLGFAWIISGRLVMKFDYWWYFFGNRLIMLPGIIIFLVSFPILIPFTIHYIRKSKTTKSIDISRDKDFEFNKRNLIKIILIPTIISLIISSTVMCIILIPRISDYNYLSAEIMIRSDDDLVKYNLPGSGTENDPYRIENLTINTRKNGILVTQISKSLIIRNCTITAGVNGIRICGNYKSTNIVIENNTCIISPRKIRTLYSYNCYVQNIGIQASYASNIVIRNNYCYHISNYNRYSFGIFLMYVMNVSVLNNICYNSYSGMYVNANENVSLINNTCYNNYQGFTIDGRNLILLNNNCSSNFYGMYFWYSLNNTISYNNLENNSIGIHFYNSDNNTIFYNQIHYCTSYAICVGNRSNDNIFHHNNLFNNSQHYPLQTQVFDDGINFWYDIEFGENGNYWSDLIWYLGCQYEIDGGSNTDPYPLQHPVDI